MSSPSSLYDISLCAAVRQCATNGSFQKKEFRCLPNSVLFDFYYKMFEEKRLCLLALEYRDIDIFLRMLRVNHRRTQMLQSIQGLVDHGSNVLDELMVSYKQRMDVSEDVHYILDVTFHVSNFLIEGGWWSCACDLMNAVIGIATSKANSQPLHKKLLQLYTKKVFAEAMYCDFKAAQKTLNESRQLIEKFRKLRCLPNLASIYSHYSVLFFTKSEYDEAFIWAQEAMKELNENLPPRVIIDVLRQASKSCVTKRRFTQAGFLIRQAVNLDSQLYQLDKHPHFSDTLLDYGFYLLNYDSIQESVKVYEKALNIRREIFDKNNIHVALALEDLAYALYVNEYSSGRFGTARENAEKALKIMERVLPKDHLMLASVKRVKALIVEEQALDQTHDPELQDSYLKEAERLHKSALELSYKAFGERNVQTAKHYGNLGRLYQSMKQYKEAEKMHLRAIAIKEELLGKADYEVALSIGHLASLYNYHMERHEDAEVLYKRSISINLHLFGESYSGLEYDYRGLINVYSRLLDISNMNRYTHKMRQWKLVRDKIKPVVHKEEIMPVAKIVEKFFSMCDNTVN